MADLAQLSYDPNFVFDVELRGPDGAPLLNDDGSQMTWGIFGVDSDIAIKARNAVTNRYLRQRGRAQVTAESSLADQCSQLARISARWNVTMGGSKPPFSQDEALKLLLNPGFAFIRDQLQEAHEDRANFSKGSSPS